jgi:hypothetical protein
MKFTKTILVTAILAVATLTASAQKAGLYQTFNGGTTRLVAGTTNSIATGTNAAVQYGLPGTSTNIAQTVGEFDYVGLTWSFTGSTNATLKLYKSFDNGLTYEANPSFSYSGSGTFATNASIDVHSVTHLGVVLANVGTLDATNHVLEFNLKSPKMLWKQATQ